MTDEQVELVIDVAVEAARAGLRAAIGETLAAYPKADRFMETFEPLLRLRLTELPDAEVPL